MDEHDAGDETLQAIASALGLPVAAFHDPGCSALQRAQDVADLLQAFEQIADPEIRRGFIDAVRRAAVQRGDPRA
ncbi:hypothetical protein [Methylobacterium sp. A54F]